MDFMTDLEQGAVHAHELYSSLVKAGFSDEHAIRIVIGVLQAAVQNGN